ncbi:MarR family winged helix-turn-helix transcriptional regulator [Streptomyces sp. V4I2]|uniref:MarR family winged helix-turn-helix transcriptional regulator n=1 Tax=Streptomyces sp. V4I2 TaxID=3042280 RepID=UPI0027858BCC|nr:MarR family transcriptional regulator [Streptomyces sp. V4I2]MDQ1047516.1 DNA-binding MarR family transcriptional regulator [Streptomyces sp. V4I2]
MTDRAAREQGPWNNPGFLLWRVTLRWQRAVAGALRPYELTHPQFVVLASAWWLGRHGQPPSQRELAEHAGMDAMTASQVARALEGKRLISREQDPHDTRIKRLHVTEQGTALAREAIELVEAVDRAYFQATPDGPAFVEALLALDAQPGSAAVLPGAGSE